jgi:prophage maintenance system killer protein
MNTKLRLGDLPPSKIKWINITDFEGLCFNLAKAHFSFKQPIPDFVTRNPGILESCLGTPLQSFGGEDPYPTFIDKLSFLFYLLIKNHPFQNGNKRIAVMTLLAVLYLNGLWLNAGKLKPYTIAVYVAGSKREDKEKVTKTIKAFITDHLERF